MYDLIGITPLIRVFLKNQSKLCKLNSKSIKYCLSKSNKDTISIERVIKIQIGYNYECHEFISCDVFTNKNVLLTKIRICDP